MPDTHQPEDWLDEALRARSTCAPPPEFTVTVMNRVAPIESETLLALFWTEGALPVGLSLVGLGLSSAVDLRAVGIFLEGALQAPSAGVTAVALRLAAVWFALTTGETA